MPFSFVRVPGRGGHDHQMLARGRNPLVVIGNRVEDIKSVLDEHHLVASPHDPDEVCVRYATLELLLAPLLSADEEVARELVLDWLISPAAFTSAWEELVEGNFNFSVASLRPLDVLHDEVLAWEAAHGTRDSTELAMGDLVKVAEPTRDRGWPADDPSTLWCSGLTFGHLATTRKNIGRRALVLGMLGPRSIPTDRDADSELLEVAKVTASEFDRDNSGHASLSIRFKIKRIVDWAAARKVDALFFDPEALVVDATRLDAVLNMFEAARLASSDRNQLVRLMLPRVLSKYKAIGAFVGDSSGAAVIEALCLIAEKLCKHRYSGSLAPESLNAVEEELVTWQDTFTATGVTNMSAKLSLVLTSAKLSGGSVSKESESSGLSDTGNKQEALRRLKKSKEFLDALAEIRLVLDGAEVNSLELMRTAFQTGCGVVIKHMTGLKDFSFLHQTLEDAARFRAASFTPAKLHLLARSMSELVLPKVRDEEGIMKRDPLLEGHEFPVEFVSQLLSGDWENIDFPGVLVIGPRKITHSETWHGRARKTWYVDTNVGAAPGFQAKNCFTVVEMVNQLATRMKLLFTQFLPYKADQKNGVESVVQALLEALDMALAAPMFEKSLLRNANGYMLMAMRDAGLQWANFWTSTNPTMTLPAHFLPAISSCKVQLDNSMENARVFRTGAHANAEFYSSLSTLIMGVDKSREPGVSAPTPTTKTRRGAPAEEPGGYTLHPCYAALGGTPTGHLRTLPHTCTHG